MQEYTQVVGIIAGILTAVSLLPQLFKILKEKKTDDISYWMLGVLIVGLCGWLYYGILKKDYPIIITNAVSIVINLFTSALTLKYRKK